MILVHTISKYEVIFKTDNKQHIYQPNQVKLVLTNSARSPKVKKFSMKVRLKARLTGRSLRATNESHAKSKCFPSWYSLNRSRMKLLGSSGLLAANAVNIL